ncbi:uncharacterized protein L199_008078 [Kwoniella botswanensis]|uniref:uncharacterized protein n=1 Tax=Kwoniella botswanensis TaxID=1268659 RepID=UPI00315DCB2C
MKGVPEANHAEKLKGFKWKAEEETSRGYVLCVFTNVLSPKFGGAEQNGSTAQEVHASGSTARKEAGSCKLH